MKIFLLLGFLVATCQCAPNEDRLNSFRKRQLPTPTGTQFHRTCNYNGDCTFLGSVFLSCENNVCVCENTRHRMMDIAFYPVKLDSGKCTVGSNAKCGTSDGLTITCEDNIPCVQGRCRKEIHTRPLNYYCEDDIDCEEGLVCRPAQDSFPPSKYCENP